MAHTLQSTSLQKIARVVSPTKWSTVFFCFVLSTLLVCTLGARGFSCAVSGFRQVLKSDAREKPLGQSAIPLIAPSQLQPRLYQNIQNNYGCFADWFLGDIECFKCSDWITITIGAWSERGCFEGDKDQIQTISRTFSLFGRESEISDAYTNGRFR